MKNKNIFYKIIFLFIFATFTVAENALPFIGSDTPYSLSFFIFLMYLKYENITDPAVSFLYGFIKDSINSIFHFGLFSLFYLFYFYIIKYSKGKNISEIIVALFYVINYGFCSLLLNSFDIFSLVKSLLFYIFARFVVLLVFKI